MIIAGYSSPSLNPGVSDDLKGVVLNRFSRSKPWNPILVLFIRVKPTHFQNAPSYLEYRPNSLNSIAFQLKSLALMSENANYTSNQVRGSKCKNFSMLRRLAAKVCDMASAGWLCLEKTLFL